MAKKKGDGYAYHNPNNADDGVKVNGGDSNDSGCCSIACLKFSLHIFNVLFFLTGLALAFVGFKICFEKHPALSLLGSTVHDVTGVALLAAGAFVVAASLLGCLAVCLSRRKLALGYAVALAIALVVEAGAGLAAYSLRGRVASDLETELRERFNEEYGRQEYNATTLAVDGLQLSLKCCGVRSVEDWRQSEWWKDAGQRGRNLVPDSCCISPSPYCGQRDHPSNVRYTGCVEKIENIASANLKVAGALCTALCLVQLVGLVLACSLYRRLRALVYYG